MCIRDSGIAAYSVPVGTRSGDSYSCPDRTVPFLRCAHDEDDGSQITFGHAAFDSPCRRKEGLVGISGFIPVPWCRCSDMRWHALSQHVHPLAAHVRVAVTRKMELP